MPRRAVCRVLWRLQRGRPSGAREIRSDEPALNYVSIGACRHVHRPPAFKMDVVVRIGGRALADVSVCDIAAQGPHFCKPLGYWRLPHHLLYRPPCSRRAAARPPLHRLLRCCAALLTRTCAQYCHRCQAWDRPLASCCISSLASRPALCMQHKPRRHATPSNPCDPRSLAVRRGRNNVYAPLQRTRGGRVLCVGPSYHTTPAVQAPRAPTQGLTGPRPTRRCTRGTLAASC